MAARRYRLYRVVFLQVIFSATLLYVKGCNARTNNNQKDELIVACANGDIDTVEILLRNGVDANAQEDTYPDKPIYYAIVNNHPRVVNLLLDSGVDKNCDWGEEQGTLLTNAAQFGHLGIVKILVERGAEVNLKRPGHSALYYAMIYDHSETVLYLKENGAVLSQLDKEALKELGWRRKEDKSAPPKAPHE